MCQKWAETNNHPKTLWPQKRPKRKEITKMGYKDPPKRKPSSYVCDQTRRVFIGQQAIADWLHVSQSTVNEHLTGKRPDVKGYLSAGPGKEPFTVHYTFTKLKEHDE